MLKTVPPPSLLSTRTHNQAQFNNPENKTHKIKNARFTKQKNIISDQFSFMKLTLPVQSLHHTYHQSKQWYLPLTILFSFVCISRWTWTNLHQLHIEFFKKIQTWRVKKTENKKITSTRQSCSIKRLIQRVPGMGLVLTTLYFPFGFHTSIETGLAMIANWCSEFKQV